MISSLGLKCATFKNFIPQLFYLGNFPLEKNSIWPSKSQKQGPMRFGKPRAFAGAVMSLLCDSSDSMAFISQCFMPCNANAIEDQLLMSFFDNGCTFPEEL
jgi:hypothetical protein